MITRHVLRVWVVVLTLVVASTSGAVNGCPQWSHKSALTNTTIYIYGGGSASVDDQISPPPKDNRFHALDLSKSFNVVSSHLTGLSLPSFPVGGPASSGVGALWPSSDGKYLYLFGVDLGDSAWRSRLMWRYNIPGGSWSMIATSGAEQVPPIEGASCWIPQCGTNNSGVGVYLGGIIPETSGATGTADEGYVASTLFFDMGLHNFTRTAFPPPSPPDYIASPGRANGAVVYVPDLGSNSEGILVSLAGGTNTAMIRFDVLDIFDVSTQTWTKQYTKGPLPSERLMPCAVVASTSNTHQIYMYGGQSIYNEEPFNDMWILSLPSFTWIQVPELADNPAGRTGHTCHASGSEMLILGGWTAQGICDVDNLHIFDMSNLAWQRTFRPDTTYSVPEIVVSATKNENDVAFEPAATARVVSTTTASQLPSPSSSAVRPRSSSRPSKSTFISSFTTISLSTIRIHTLNNSISTEIVTIPTVVATSTELVSSPSNPPTGVLQSAEPTSAISNGKIGAIIGGSLGGVVLFISLGFAFFAFLRRRQRPQEFALITHGNNTPPDTRSSGYFENAASAETVNEMSEWDISEWDGDLLLSPRQSLRIVNE